MTDVCIYVQTKLKYLNYYCVVQSYLSLQVVILLYYILHFLHEKCTSSVVEIGNVILKGYVLVRQAISSNLIFGPRKNSIPFVFICSFNNKHSTSTKRYLVKSVKILIYIKIKRLLKPGNERFFFVLPL